MKISLTKMILALILLNLSACPGGTDEQPAQRAETDPAQTQPASTPAAETAEPEEAAEASMPEAMQAFTDDGNVLEISIEGDDAMRFNMEEFEVQAGQMVRLTLIHTGTLPVQSMGHNVVILEEGEDFASFAADAIQQGGSLNNEWVPEEMRDRVLAFTPLIGGGETTMVEFQAPEEAGEYPFLCSFPAHATLMNGVMRVVE